jgi:putative transposase
VVEGFYHVWFGTKGRKAALEGEIGADVQRLLAQIARGSGIGLLELEAVSDHVHLLLRLAPGQTLSSVMHQLKGASARAVFLKYPELKMDLGHHAFWQKGYGFRRVDPEQIATTRWYIATQDSRPLRHEE